LSEEDYRLILGNKDYLYGHSIWNKILLKSYITLNIRDNLILTKGLPKRYDCWNIMCSRKCNNELNFIDVIDILYHYVNSSNKSDIRENLFYELLWRVLKDVITYNTLYCIFPYLITCLKLIKIDRDYEIFIYNILCIIGESILGTPMFDPFLTLLMFEYNYIFTGINYKDTESTNTLKFLNIINIYLKKTIGDIRETNKVDSYIQKIKDTINIFVDIYDKKGSYNLEKKGEWIYPFDTKYNIIKIIEITELNSASKPVLVRVLLEKANFSVRKEENELIEKKFILKSETGLRKEQIVSQLIIILQNKLTEQMLKGRIEEFEEIPTYKILMITNNIGIIEFLDDCYTLKSISQKSYTLQNYILEHNKDDKIGAIKERFSKSLSISSCLSYILGLGDRHAGNIMISINGQIIHIDYGYILENPIHSTIFTPIIRISSDMIDFLGGFQGKYYDLFKSYVIGVFDILRLYSDIIINFYRILGYENIVNWDLFKVKLEERFLKGMNNKDIEIMLLDLIQTSSTGYGGTFVDLCNDYGNKIKSYIV